MPGISLPAATSTTISGLILSNGNQPDAQFYVERALDNLFAVGVVQVQNWSTSTSFTASGLTPGTVYFFRVKARVPGGNESDWSPPANRITVPGVPTGISATTNDPFMVTISWTKAAGAVGYVVYRNNISIAVLGDVNLFADSLASAPTISTGTVTASKGTHADHVAISVTGARANNGFSHSYQVAAFNASGTGARSINITGFRRPGPLGFQWMRSLGDHFLSFAPLEGATSSSFLDTGAPIYLVHPPGAVTVAQQYAAPDTLEVSFAAASVTAGQGRYYYPQLFADGANPVLVSPSRDRGFRHDTIAGTGGYEVWSSLAEAGPFAPVGITSTLSYADRGLNPNTRYWYKVRARSEAGTWSDFSPAASKITLAALPGINLLEGSRTSINGTIVPSGNPEATQYNLEMSAAPDFTSGVTQIQYWTPGTGFIAADLEPGTTYYFRVRARNSEGTETGWSSVQSKATLPGNLAPAVALLTEDGMRFSAGGGKITLAWSSSDPDLGDNLSHTILIRPPGAADGIASVPSSGPGGQSHSFSVENKVLWPAGMYDWWVMVQDAHGLVTTSLQRTFNIANDPPEKPGLFNDFGNLFRGGSAVSLSWSPAGDPNQDLVRYEVDFYDGSLWHPVRGLDKAEAALTTLNFYLPKLNTDQAKFRVRTFDGSLYSPYRETAAFIIDSEPPGVPIINLFQEDGAEYLPGAVASQPVKFTLGGSVDNLTGVSYQYSLNGGIDWTHGKTSVIITDGKTLLSFRAVDGAGNLSAEQQVIVTVSQSKPNDTRQEEIRDRPRPRRQEPIAPRLIEFRVDGTRTAAIIDADQYQAMAEKDSLGVIPVVNGKISFFLPLKEMDIPSLTRELGVSSAKDLKIHLYWQPSDIDAAPNIGEMIVKLGGEPLGLATEFKVFLAANNGNKKEVASFKSFVARRIELYGTEHGNLTAVWIDPVSNELIPVPTSIAIREEKTEVTIRHRGTGVYALIRLQPKNFFDIRSHWARTEIESMAKRKIIHGKDNGLFDPDKSVTRAEFAAMIVRSLGLTAKGDGRYFNDVGGRWYERVVKAAAEAGLVRGYADGGFGPNNPITREEIGVLIARALKKAGYNNNSLTGEVGMDRFQDAENISPWAMAELSDAIRAGVMRGNNDGKLYPQGNATRAEAAVMLKRMLYSSGLIP
ncbi:MAG: S-layer homology domain-containing protein [Syntrophomonadaceae bacterium]|nr:S-layer homology domain-containing protein [Syntrophomonadaceae bacterium]